MCCLVFIFRDKEFMYRATGHTRYARPSTDGERQKLKGIVGANLFMGNIKI